MRIPKIIQQLAPLWTQRIKEEKIDYKMEMEEPRTINNKKLDIGVQSCCVAGEVWGFSDDYINKCDACDDYGMELWRGINYVEEDRFRKNLNDFAKHIETEHKEFLK